MEWDPPWARARERESKPTTMMVRRRGCVVVEEPVSCRLISRY